MKIRVKGDRIIWLIVLLLAMISVVAVFSSSSFLVRNHPGGLSKTAIFLEQLRSVLFGLAALFFCYGIRLGWYRGLANIIFYISVAMLILLFIPHFQYIQNGAVRGLKMGSHTIQVFEFVKVGLVLFLAKSIERYSDKLKTFKDYFWKLLIWIIIVCAAIMVNSFSSAILLGVLSMLIMYFTEVKFRYLMITVAIAAGAVIFMFGAYKLTRLLPENIKESSAMSIFNRFGTAENRIKVFIAGEQQKDTVSVLSKEEMMQIDVNNRQSENAKVAIAGGKIFGKGPGRSTQRYSLSMAFSDFIFAFIVEEYGLLGGSIVILLYLIFQFRCITIAKRCKELFSASVVLGLSFLITIQAFLHILVNVRLLPITGHTLPLISHGGTAYLVLSGAFGIILSVSRTLDTQDKIKAMEEKAAEQTEINENTESNDIINENENNN